MTSRTLFFYGTLRDAETRSAVLGPLADEIEVRPARMIDIRVSALANEDYPIALPEAGAFAEGVVAIGLSEDAIARLNFFEDEFDYALETHRVETPEGVIEAEVFIFHGSTLRTDGPWDFARWQVEQQPAFVAAAAELMQHYGIAPMDQVETLWQGIRYRSMSATRARMEPEPGPLRSPLRRGDVEVVSDTRPYSDFFAVREFALRHRRYDGGVSPVLNRAAWMAGDAVTVLPWDPATDQVLLVEQFRPGPFARGDKAPWMLEPIAGRIDGLEDPRDTARRETLEEAGVTVGRLAQVCAGYPSPGTTTERLECFVGEADLSRAGGVHGLAGEDEDIRSVLLLLDEAEAAIRRGDINVLPLTLSLFWLRLNHARLRAEWLA